ncbi:hypothetical protein [Mesorhizobium sp. M8A.F.Ca.ET.165.01.1.1]|uniref:hypothetical protein n=1 Tax=Mesorhizobium sp. M8A.F.Ca.ET.165.01.1.1 TaxID=2563960 RepID=UPI001093F3C1|nr:hypothetical protein [Mesorhizobium sp. M8A.F.Ca.ET.165.01.1.1]TGT35701.1 hypothetical protein EN808_31955 [Mesorhizobium sp. M8A.F.Ca.ET.165.01.1.1]
MEAVIYLGETMMANSPIFPQLRRFFGSLKRGDSVTIDEQASRPTHETGSSIMNQHVNRSALLTSSAIATAAVAAASEQARAGGRSAARVSGELERLIEAKDAAYAAFNAALTVAWEADERYFVKNRKELFVDLSVGGAQSFHPDFERDYFHHDVRNDVIKRYEEHTRKLAGLEKINPAMAADAKDALNSALIKDLRTFRQVLRGEIAKRKAAGQWQAQQAVRTASQADLDTFTDICAYRCQNDAELARKSSVISYWTGPKFGEMQSEDLQVLLASMIPAGPEVGQGAAVESPFTALSREYDAAYEEWLVELARDVDREKEQALDDAFDALRTQVFDYVPTSVQEMAEKAEFLSTRWDQAEGLNPERTKQLFVGFGAAHIQQR